MRSGLMQIVRGDTVLVALDPVVGSEQGKTRPAVIVQNNIGNKYAPTTIVVPLTTNIERTYPTDVIIGETRALCSQIRTIDKTRIQKITGRISEQELHYVDTALKVSLGL